MERSSFWIFRFCRVFIGNPGLDAFRHTADNEIVIIEFLELVIENI